jgi:hypothetical protein
VGGGSRGKGPIPGPCALPGKAAHKVCIVRITREDRSDLVGSKVDARRGRGRGAESRTGDMGCTGSNATGGAESLTGAQNFDPEHPRGMSSGRIVVCEPESEAPAVSSMGEVAEETADEVDESTVGDEK